MKKYGEKSAIIFVALCLVFLSQAYGQSYSSRKGQSMASKVPRISAELAYMMYKTGLVTIVDSMRPRTFAKYHILGAVNLPGDGRADLERIRRAKLPIAKNRGILVYCD